LVDRRVAAVSIRTIVQRYEKSETGFGLNEGDDTARCT